MCINIMPWRGAQTDRPAGTLLLAFAMTLVIGFAVRRARMRALVQVCVCFMRVLLLAHVLKKMPATGLNATLTARRATHGMQEPRVPGTRHSSGYISTRAAEYNAHILYIYI